MRETYALLDINSYFAEYIYGFKHTKIYTQVRYMATSLTFKRAVNVARVVVVVDVTVVVVVVVTAFVFLLLRSSVCV